MKTWKKN